MKRRVRLQVYCTEEEAAVIQAVAKQMNEKSVSKFLRTLPTKYLKAIREFRSEYS